MNYNDTMKALCDSILVPVLRTDSTELADKAIDCLVNSGFKTIEITTTIPGIFDLIAKWSKKQIQVGAGTVLNLESARRCIDAGASFIVSPIIIDGLPELCHKHEVVCILGALTPNEVNTVLSAGCDIVKVYPISSVGGPSHLKALLDIFPNTLFMPTGGIKADNLIDYMEAGASLLGAGSSLIDYEALKESDYNRVQNQCKEYIEILDRYKKGAK